MLWQWTITCYTVYYWPSVLLNWSWEYCILLLLRWFPCSLNLIMWRLNWVYILIECKAVNIVSIVHVISSLLSAYETTRGRVDYVHVIIFKFSVHVQDESDAEISESCGWYGSLEGQWSRTHLIRYCRPQVFIHSVTGLWWEDKSKTFGYVSNTLCWWLTPVKEHPRLRSVSEAGVSGLLLGCPVPKQYWHADPLPMDSKYNIRSRIVPTFIDSIDKPAYKDLKVTFWTDYRRME